MRSFGKLAAPLAKYRMVPNEPSSKPSVMLALSSVTAKPGALPAGAKVVTAPSGRGLLLMRVLVGDYAAEREAVEAARRSLRCTPLG